MKYDASALFPSLLVLLSYFARNAEKEIIKVPEQG
jgi:hypothetical protein